MNIVVHRGTHEIGGCCTEISTENTRILIDYGSKLNGSSCESINVPYIKDCDAVFVTHNHGDHIGELANIPDCVPIYMSSTAKRITEAYCRHMGTDYLNGFDVSRVIEIHDYETVTLKGLEITAVPSDHSACGSYMYLVIGNGKKILHTGDYRLHGPHKDRLFAGVSAIGKIDLLISEGTTLEREGTASFDENRVEDVIRSLQDRYKYCFVLCSSGNIDRIASATKTVPRGKYFLVDKFQKSLLQIAEEQDKEYRGVFNKALVIGNNLKAKAEKRGFCMITRANSQMRKWLEYFSDVSPSDTCLIYSMWSGYLNQPSIKDFCSLANNMHMVHSSGHVVLQDMNELINILDPDSILFIHTEAQADTVEIDLKSRIICLRDGEVFSI